MEEYFEIYCDLEELFYDDIQQIDVRDLPAGIEIKMLLGEKHYSHKIPLKRSEILSILHGVEIQDKDVKTFLGQEH